MFKNRFQRRGDFRALWPALAVVVLVACGDDEAGFTDVLAGSGGSAGWTFVPTAGTPALGGSNAMGGTPSSSAGSAGAAGKGGVSGSNGNGGSGGSTTNPPVTFDCAGLVPDQPLITRFDGFSGNLWSSPGNLNGGAYVYPEPQILAAGEFLRFDAQVSDYTGMGAWFAGCFDASSFEGIRLTVYGDVGESASIHFYLITNRDRDVDEASSVGGCVPDDDNDPWQSCRPPFVVLPVTGEPIEHSVPFSAFGGGLPTAGSDGSDLLALQWSLDWTDVNSSTPYPAQLTIDNLEFYGKGSGEGGAGGGPTEPMDPGANAGGSDGMAGPPSL